MPDLPEPMEILELQAGESVSFRVERWEVGTTTIHPAHQPEGKTLKTIRVHVPKEDKPLFPHYWDFNAKTLVAQIEPHLQRGDLRDLRFGITAWGIAAKKRFTVEVRPPGVRA